MATKQKAKAKKTVSAKKVSKPAKKKNTPAKKVSKLAKKPNTPAKKITKPVKKQSAPVKKVTIPFKKQSAPIKKASTPVKKQSAPVKKASSPVKKVATPIKKVIAQVKTDTKPAKKAPAPANKPRNIIRTDAVFAISNESSGPKKEYTGPKKIKYQTEIEIHASPKILYPYLSTSSGLAEWFANKVNESGGIFTFSWDGSQKNARLVSRRENQSVKFHWIDDPDETFFEIEIIQDDITSDVALLITDFCLPGEKEADCSLWESQIHDLMHVVGS